MVVGKELGGLLRLAVGREVGASLGIFEMVVGALLISEVGNTLGRSLGTLVGKKLGVVVCTGLGGLLTIVVGREVGALLGFVDGSNVGATVGCKLGILLGTLIGEELGRSVCSTPRDSAFDPGTIPYKSAKNRKFVTSGDMFALKLWV